MLKYFSADEQYINAECDNCERVLKIPRNYCVLSQNGLEISRSILCKCGTRYSMIDSLPKGYDHQYVAKKVPKKIIEQSPEQILAKSLLDDIAGYIRMRDWEGSNLAAEMQWQSEAMQQVVDIGEPAIDPLIELLKDLDWAVRDDAALMLGRIQNIKAIQPLIAIMMNDKDIGVQKRAASALRSINTPASRNAVHLWYQKVDQLEKDQVKSKILGSHLADGTNNQISFFDKIE